MFLLRVECDDAARLINHDKNFADRKFEKISGLKKIEKFSKNDLQNKKSVIY